MNPYYLFITFLEFSFSRSHLSFAYLLVAKISIPVFVDFYSHLLTCTFHVFLLIITWYVHVLHFFPFILSTFIYRCTTICPFNYPASSPFIWYLHIRFFSIRSICIYRSNLGTVSYLTIQSYHHNLSISLSPQLSTSLPISYPYFPFTFLSFHLQAKRHSLSSTSLRLFPSTSTSTFILLLSLLLTPRS